MAAISPINNSILLQKCLIHVNIDKDERKTFKTCRFDIEMVNTYVMLM